MNLKAQLRADAPYSEVVDSIADVFEAGRAIANALSDGFQINDILTLLQTEDEFRDVVASFPTFLNEFVKLTPNTAQKAVNEAKARVIQNTGDLDRISQFIFDILNNLSGGYAFVAEVYEKALEQIENWKGLSIEPKDDQPMEPVQA
jgi:hypothetical protein